MIEWNKDYMFSHITDLAYKRSVKEAVGFYIFYLVLYLLVFGPLVFFLLWAVNVTDIRDAIEFGGTINAGFNFTSMILVFMLSIIMLMKKKLFRDPNSMAFF